MTFDPTEYLKRCAASEIENRFFVFFPQIGTAIDGSAIRDVGGNHLCRETSGYLCSSVAYSVRRQFNDTWWMGEKDAVRSMLDAELIDILKA